MSGVVSSGGGGGGGQGGDDPIRKDDKGKSKVGSDQRMPERRGKWRHVSHKRVDQMDIDIVPDAQKPQDQPRIGLDSVGELAKHLPPIQTSGEKEDKGKSKEISGDAEKTEEGRRSLDLRAIESVPSGEASPGSRKRERAKTRFTVSEKSSKLDKEPKKGGK